jgi:NAD(P)-dependent dehydrogenase (short-subunit alcohol dehydrogenase family)
MHSGKNVIITGVSGGIGTAMVEKLLEAGAVIYGFDLAEPKTSHPNLHFTKLDATNSEAVEKAVSSIPAKIDYLLHIVGIMRRGSVLESSVQDYDLIMNINLKATWLMQKHAEKVLASNATVLFLSSRHGIHPKSDPGLYSLTKQATWAYAEILQRTRPGYKIKVAFPGSIDTPLSWFGVPPEEVESKRAKMISPDSIAENLIRLISEDAKYLYYDEHTRKYQFLNEITSKINFDL